MNHISQNKGHVRGGKWRVAPAMTLGLALFLTGCESLLQVELFGNVTSDILDNPNSAELLVNTAVARVECGYSRFTAGNPVGDVFLAGSGRVAMEYEDVIAQEGGSDSCFPGIDVGDNYYQWFHSMQEGRFHAEDGYFRLDTLYTSGDGGEFDIAPFLTGDWATQDHMQAVMALYAAIPYMLFGEHLCETTIEKSQPTARLPDPLAIMDPDTTLGIAEEWINTALTHFNAYWADTIANGGDPAEVRELPFGITDNSEEMAYGLRSRIRWARAGAPGGSGDLTGAAADALLVSNGFMAFASRSDDIQELARQNHIHAAHFRFVAGSIAGPIDWWIDPHPPGTYPGQPWPLNGAGPASLIPFTGYLGLVIDPADGRAVDPAGNALTLADLPGGEVDTRVSHLPGIDADQAAVEVQQKFTTADQPMPMVNWKEMQLIRAEADPATAVARVNEIRAADGLTLVSYAPAGGEIENMIFEERRRALWLEGRFWSTKIQNQSAATVKLWFPRELEDQEDPRENPLQGGVRMRMQTSEFDRNPEINRSDRASLCGAAQRPVNPLTGDGS